MLQTVSMFQIIEYDFVPVYIDENTTERTPIHNTDRRDTVTGFELVEWICEWFVVFLFRLKKQIFCQR